MKELRKQLKAESRILLRQGQMSPLGFTAVYLGILLILEVTINFLIDSIFATMVANLVSMLLGTGMILYCMGLRRRETMSLSVLFDGFSFAGQIIWLHVLRALLLSVFALAGLLAASLLTSVVGVAVYGDGFASMLLDYMARMQAAQTLTPELLPGVLLSAGMLFLGSLPALAISYRYRFAVYNLCLDPQQGALSCLRLSRQQTQGSKWQLFVLDLSFLGWFFLSLLTGGILLIWVIPYYRTVDLGIFQQLHTISSIERQPS